MFRTDPLGGPVHTILKLVSTFICCTAPVAVVVMSCIIILQLIQRVGLTVIEDHRDGVCYNVAGGVEHACCIADIMVGQVSQLPRISACPGDFSGVGTFLQGSREVVAVTSQTIRNNRPIFARTL